MSTSLRSTALLSTYRAIAIITSTVLGVLSAAYFGTSWQKDSFIIAGTLPTLLTNIIVGGIYSTLLIGLARGDALTGGSRIGHARFAAVRLSVPLVPIVLAVLLFPQAVIGLIAPGFGAEEATLAGSLLRIAIVTVIASVYFAVLRSFFNSQRQFAVPGAANVFIGICSIVVLVAGVNSLGIYSLAIGPLVGTALAVVFLTIIATRSRSGDSESPRPALRDTPGPRKDLFWTNFIAMSVAANFGQVNILVGNLFGSYLPSGSITMLGFAFVIISTAQLLTVFSLADVALPRFAALSREDPEALGAYFRRTLRFMFMVTAPFAFGGLAFGQPLSRALFERGAFGAASTAGVATLIACYSPILLLAGYRALFWRLLIATRRFGLVAAASVAAIAVNALLNYLLIPHFGVNGIALSTTLVTLLYVLGMVPFARGTIGRIHSPGDGVLVCKVLFSAVTMAVIVWLWGYCFESFIDVTNELPRVLEVLIGLGLASLVYFGLLRILQIREVREVEARLLRRFRMAKHA